MVKVTEIVYNYVCGQCSSQVVKGKYQIYCGVCGKNLCKKCGKKSICDVCEGELAESEKKVINKAVKKNRTIFWLALSPFLAILPSILISGLNSQLDLPPELFLIIDNIAGALFFYFALGFFPGICIWAVNINVRYSKVLKKIETLPLPTYEGFYNEFAKIFNERVEMALTQYPKKQRFEMQKQIYSNDGFITPIIQEFVDKKLISYPNFRERIVTSCNGLINNIRQIYHLF